METNFLGGKLFKKDTNNTEICIEQPPKTAKKPNDGGKSHFPPDFKFLILETVGTIGKEKVKPLEKSECRLVVWELTIKVSELLRHTYKVYGEFYAIFVNRFGFFKKAENNAANSNDGGTKILNICIFSEG